jgi:hypothetical protein
MKDRIDGSILPSSMGVHSSLTMTARGHMNTLVIRTIIQISSKSIEVDFHSLHLAYISVSVGDTCHHNRRDPLTITGTSLVLTSVTSPVASGERLSLALTHCNPEAQFLCCAPGVRILFQGNSCLNCAVKHAQDNRFGLIIPTYNLNWCSTYVHCGSHE